MKKKTISSLSVFLLLLSINFIDAYAEQKDGHGYEIEDYSYILGKDVQSVKKIFGSENMREFKFPLHDPGSYIEGFEISVLEQAFFLLTEENKISSIFFKSSAFSMRKGIRTGQSFCEVLKIIPNATFLFSFDEGVILRLSEQNFIFEFSTGNLPLEQYILKGKPDKKTPSLCLAVLEKIKIHR